MMASYKIVPSETGSFVVKPEGKFVSFVSFFSPESKTNSNSSPTPAPSPSTGATVSVTGFPADPTYSSSTPLTVNVGYVLLIAVGMYVLGRIHQYFKDEKRGLGPKPPKGGQS